MILGAHQSIAGGVFNAPILGKKVGCDTIQIFTKNSNQWKAKPLRDEEIRKFHEEKKKAGIEIVFGHDSYLINIASPDNVTYEKSIPALIEEVQRSEQLGLPWLVMHPGAHKGEGEEAGLKKIAKSLDKVLEATKGFATKIALENTAGQGSALGFRFEQLQQIIDMCKYPERLGVCFDTCHAFAAGYDVSSKEGYEQTFDELNRIIGFDRLLCFHLNDAMKDLGSRVDRHTHIGKGKIGLDGFRLLMNDKRFVNTPMVLETPKGKELKEDKMNLRTLRKLIKK
jgi:deoxyribonuclease IV